MVRGKCASVLISVENWYNRYEKWRTRKIWNTKFYIQRVSKRRLQTKLESHSFVYNFQMFKLLSENEIRQVHYNVCLWDQRSCIIVIWNNNLTQLVTTWNQEHIKKKLITNKVNRCLARYSPRATTTNQISLHGLAQIDQKCQIWSFLGKKSFFLLEKSKVLLPT